MSAMGVGNLIGVVKIKNGKLIAIIKGLNHYGLIKLMDSRLLDTSKTKKIANVLSNCLGMKSKNCLWSVSR